MRYRADIGDDCVGHLIGQCLRSKTEAKRIYDILIFNDRRKIDLITGSVHLTPEEHAEFAARFSSEVGPTIRGASCRKH